MDDRTLAAFMERVQVNPITGCWVWCGYINPRNRYGSFTSWEDGKARTYSVHRTVYELFVGPIPVKMVLDHRCWHRACCNPVHLEPITQAENIRRGAAAKYQDGAAFQRNKTGCPQGHPYDGENTGRRKGGERYCKACGRAASAASKAKRGAANPKPPRQPQRFCKRGHEFTPENTYVIPSTGSRSCRECKRADVKAYREKPRSEVKYRAEICKNGHAMDGSNSSYASNGTRICKACSREKSQRHAEKVAEAAKAAGLTVREFLAAKSSGVA